jgi:nickel-dependent lactate racemase
MADVFVELLDGPHGIQDEVAVRVPFGLSTVRRTDLAVEHDPGALNAIGFTSFGCPTQTFLRIDIQQHGHVGGQ